MMTPERWAAIDHVWQAVLARPEDERMAALAELSKGDESLRRDVESLLGHLARANAAGFGREPLAVEPPSGLLIGRQLGPYTVRALLGVGGMGEVYRAHDSMLGREVALKMLPEPSLADSERRARFEREAKFLASLNHPNIGAIYGVLESESPSETGRVRALVLELVEGETLAERIARRATVDSVSRGLPIDEAVRIANQLLAALEAAHERGIVHRDLKPANIKITPNATVKVLDFGLARAVGRDDSGTETSTDQSTRPGLTQMGLLLGTATYMSPEQARGRSVDKRTDIWAFGCVLYEMLTGAPAFGGTDLAEILANVIKAEPDLSALPPDTPSALRICLRRCLQKDPGQRFHDIADARLAMEGAFEPAAHEIREGRPPRFFAQNGIALSGWAVAGVVVIAAAAGMFPSVRRVGSESTNPGPVSQQSPPVLLNPSAAGGGGSATAATIQEAIDRVAPGGTVQMLPGTYREAITITKGLTLEASGERTGPVIIDPPATAKSAIVIATTEPVLIRALTVHIPGEYGVRATGGVNLTIQGSTLLAVKPPDGTSRLIDVSNDATTTGRRARVAVRGSSFDGTIAKLSRQEGRPLSQAIAVRGDVDGVIERNIIRRTGAVCLTVQTRDDFAGETNIDIVNNDIDECHPVARVGSILVGSPPVATLSPDRPVTATGTVNIIGNFIRNSSQDCLNSAIAFDVFSGRIERNRIVDFVQPCSQLTTRNRPGAIWIGLRIKGITMPPVVPSVRFNDIHGNVRAGLRIGDDQTVRVDATCNYWGSERGPSGVGPGDGDPILVQPGAPEPVFVPFAKAPIAQAPAGRC
jgi:serine/threonine protein kinase